MQFFPEVDKIRFEGPDSTNALSFRHYQADEQVEGKSMREHLRFSIAYWHTMRNTGGDPFRARVRTTALGRRHRFGRYGAQARARRLRVHGKNSACLSIVSTTAMWRRKGPTCARPTPTSNASHSS